MINGNSIVVHDVLAACFIVGVVVRQEQEAIFSHEAIQDPVRGGYPPARDPMSEGIDKTFLTSQS